MEPAKSVKPANADQGSSTKDGAFDGASFVKSEEFTKAMIRTIVMTYITMSSSNLEIVKMALDEGE